MFRNSSSYRRVLHELESPDMRKATTTTLKSGILTHNKAYVMKEKVLEIVRLLPPKRLSNSIQKDTHPGRRQAQPSLRGDPALRYLIQRRSRQLHDPLRR